MSVDHMRRYLSNATHGPSAAHEQIQILQLHAQHLDAEQRRLTLRQRYIKVKITFWEAIQHDDATRITELTAEAALASEELRQLTV